MITAADFLAEAASHGFDFYTGVPCSFLTPLINGVLSRKALAYVGAASEGEAGAEAPRGLPPRPETGGHCPEFRPRQGHQPPSPAQTPLRRSTPPVTTRQ